MSDTATVGQAICLAGIGKHYAGVAALDDIELEIRPSEVHALIGENGAGKSTLGRIIAGAARPDTGTLTVFGTPKVYRSPHEALADGVAAIQQEIALVPGRSVLENVFLGNEMRRRRLPDVRGMRRRLREVQDEIGFDLTPDVLVGELSIAEQQKVEILRAIVRRARVVVMDEPTAALGPREVDALLDTMRRLKQSGTTLVFVSHRLTEVLAISDRITVLRNGRLIQTTDAADVSADQLVSSMLGRELAESFPPLSVAPARITGPRLTVSNLRSKLLNDISLSVYGGEIVGLAGLVGSGRSEVARAIFGVQRADAGLITIDGETATIRDPRDAANAGLAFVPESRKDDGLVMGLSVQDNLMLASNRRLSSRWGRVRVRQQAGEVKQLMSDLDIRPRTPQLSVSSLSGGNQQKVLLGKWLACAPKVLIADEPTRGVDVGAKFAIYELLVQLAQRGVAILVISSELPEILGLCHRILVMRNGALAGEFSREEATEDLVMSAAFGTSRRSEFSHDSH